MATTAAPTPDDTILPPPGERPERVDGWARENKQLVIALGLALLLHFLPVLYVVGKLVVAGGDLPSDDEIGDPRGEAKGVNVEMIDATEFNEKYTSFGKGKEVASSLDEKPQPAKPPQKQQPPTPQQPPSKQATPQKPQEQKPVEQKPAEQKQAEQKQPEQKQAEQKPLEEKQPEPKQAEQKPPLKEPPKEAAEKPEEVADLDTPGLPQPPPPKPEPKPTEQAKEAAAAPPPSPASPPSQQMTEQEVTEAFEEAKKNKVEAAAGKAQSGRVSPFVRSTQRKLFLGTPVFSNEKGTVTAFLIIGLKGEIALLRIVESSGNPTIDNAVIAGIRTQRFDVPPPGTTPKERAVVVTYEY